MQKLPLLKKSFFNNLFLAIFILFLPTQFGRHFFFSFSYIFGTRIDYLAPTLYFTDLIVFMLLLLNFKSVLNFFKNKKILLTLLIFIPNLILSQSPYISIYKLLKLIELLMVFAVFRTNKIDKRLILYSFLGGAIFESILAILQFVNKESMQGIFYFFGERLLSLSTPAVAKASLSGVEILRAYATFSHPNSLAGFYLLIYTFFLFNKNFDKYLTAKNILLGLCSILIFLSFSKLALLTFFAVNIFKLLQKQKGKICRLCDISKLITIIVLVAVFMSAKTDPQTWQKRVELNTQAISIISKNMLIKFM